MGSVAFTVRAWLRQRWRAWLSLALIIGIFTGGVVTAAAGARRTGSAYARFLSRSKAPDAWSRPPTIPDLPRSRRPR